MTETKRLVYLGNDEEFTDKLTELATEYIDQKWDLFSGEYSQGSLTSILADNGANIVYIDLDFVDSLENLFDEIVYIKRISQYKAILFTAILSSSEDTEKLMQIYSTGFQLSYIKGPGATDFIVDSLYIGLDEKVPMPRYAKATRINIDLRLGICSSLTTITNQGFGIDSDIERTEKVLEVDLPIFEDLEGNVFKIDTHRELSHFYPMTENYQLEYPFADAWEDVTNKTLQPETVETWLDIYSKNLISPPIIFKVFTEDSSLYHDIYMVSAENKIQVEICESIDEDLLSEEFQLKLPPLVFFDIDEEGNNTTEALSRIIGHIKLIEGYTPIVLVSSCPSKTEAFRKVFDYQTMICTPDKITKESFKLFTKSYMEKNSGPQANYYRVKHTDPLRAVDVLHDVYVQSLTEHELCFASPLNIPFFSTLHLTLPIDCFVTVIPSYYDLGSSKKGKHYLGLISGISEEERMLLRKFVNQIIFNPLEDFSYEEVKARFDRIEETSEEELKEQEAVAEEEIKKVENETFKRPEIRGKSKL